jgi:hypothetical protein
MNRFEKETVQFVKAHTNDVQDLLSVAAILNSPGIFLELIKLKGHMRTKNKANDRNVVAEVLRELYK